MEYEERTCLDRVIQLLQEESVKIQSMEIMRPSGEEADNPSAILSLRLPKQYRAEALLLKVNAIDSVLMAEEL